ncbi:hypothetical protein VNO77_18719 [Canavalia gladiata]|uniref:Uncharacterized protein n=1 Tax=Canavalia gladiata TaxID=3824 RepID=A0AAN9QJW6_CANGL
MASNGEENGSYKKSSRWLTNPYLFILFLSLLISIAGGFVLGWWLCKFHPTNSQLWMVPFGFILFLTPLVVWLSIIVPHLCVTKSDEDEAFKTRQRTDPLDQALPEPKR